MAIVKTTKGVEIQADKQINIQFVCPVCKSEKELSINKSVINQAKQLTTISIPRNKICPHHFQAFVDKNFKVRGYQKVDFSFESDISDERNIIVCNFKRDDNELFKNLVMKANYIEYYPENSEKNQRKIQSKYNNQKKNNESSKVKKLTIEKKEMTLEEIYEQFWEFIDDDNQEFREFIIKDHRRENKF
ncbi:MAG: hypothetical protein ACFFD5_17025 [Candidatus Thorarchaeota archaeon]